MPIAYLHSLDRLKCGLLLVLALSLTALNPARAESSKEMIAKAMQEYSSGEYSDSAGHFFAALSTDFNNPSIHYYMANCYVHMKERETAIQEYRIAYALDPYGDLGRRSNAVLKSYGVTADGLDEGDAKTFVPATGVPQSPWTNNTQSTSGKPAMSSLTSGKPVDPDALRKEISDLVKGTTSAAGAIKGGMPVYTSPVYATPSGRPPVVPTGSPLGLPAGSSTTGQQPTGGNPYVHNY